MFQFRHESPLGRTLNGPVRRTARRTLALLDGKRHPVDGQHIGGDAVVNVVGLGIAHYIVEAVAQDAFQMLLMSASFQK